MTKQGLVHIYCGDGKGKTTAAMGLALRCAGHDEKVVVAQFLKDGTSGECRLLDALPNVQVLSCNPYGKFSFQMSQQEKTETRIAIGQVFASAVQAAQEARLLVLDEAMSAMTCGFLDTDVVVDFLRHRPAGLEVVLTGRNPPQAVTALADYISEIQKVRHPFDSGLAARDGIER